MMTKISRFLRDRIGVSPSEKLTVYKYILLSAPIAIWFSYWPQISLGSDATTNFKITVAMLYCAILAAASLPRIVKNLREIFAKNHVAIWLVSAFVFYNFLSIIWSENRLRTLLTAGVVFVLYLIFLGIFATKDFAKKYVKPLAKIYVFSGIVMSLFALAQFIYGTFFTHGFLLCAGCVAGQFGFVRPNVFAIEPQFFGSLLLVPTLLVWHQVLDKQNRWSRDLIFGFLLLALFLTLSRGAIFAFILGAIVVMLLSRKSVTCAKYIKKIIIGVVFGVLSLAVCVIMQGVSAAMNPNVASNFGSAVNTSLNQLSLGIIKISQPTKTTTIKHQPHFTGYVAESTNTRTSLTQIALQTWGHESLAGKMLGVGLGGSGTAMANFTKNGDAKEIVQNEYVEILLELGVVGFALFVVALIGLVRAILLLSSEHWVLGIVVAFGLQWLFFSGYPSALHIYLTLIVLFVYAKEIVIPRRVASELAQ